MSSAVGGHCTAVSEAVYCSGRFGTVRQALASLKADLRVSKIDLNRAVAAHAYLDDMDEFAAFNKVYAGFFGKIPSHPHDGAALEEDRRVVAASNNRSLVAGRRQPASAGQCNRDSLIQNNLCIAQRSSSTGSATTMPSARKRRIRNAVSRRGSCHRPRCPVEREILRICPESKIEQIAGKQGSSQLLCRFRHSPPYGATSERGIPARWA